MQQPRRNDGYAMNISGVVFDLGVGLAAAAIAYFAYQMTGQIGWSVATLVAATVIFVSVHWAADRSKGPRE